MTTTNDQAIEAEIQANGQCNDERGCGACFSGQNIMKNAISKPHRVRIEGDGTQRGTRIVNATTGEAIPFVQGYTVTQRVGEAAKAVIDVALPIVALECDAEVVITALAVGDVVVCPDVDPERKMTVEGFSGAYGVDCVYWDHIPGKYQHETHARNHLRKVI